MTGRAPPLYPFLFAVLPLLNVLARSPGGSDLSDMGLMIAVMLGACAVLYGLVLLLGRGRLPKTVAALTVFLAIVWFYSYSAVARWAQTVLPGGAGWVIVAGAMALTAGVAWRLTRRPAALGRVTTFLALTGTLAAGWMLTRAMLHGIRTREVVAQSALAHQLARRLPMPPADVARDQAPQRDIYLIVLDEYANSAVLRERFGFDNKAFEDSLARLGFTIPRVIRSNYVHTLLSLPSLVNFSHLSRLTDEVGAHETDPTLPNYLVENNRAATFLKGRGYRFLFFPSQWWISTRHNRNADSEFQAWQGFDPARDATRTDLRRWFVRMTALPSDHSYDADHVKRTFEGLRQVPSIAEPTFAFAHVLNPHLPVVFDAGNCPALRGRSPGSGAPDRQVGYIRQVQCLNHLVLGLVTGLIQGSSPAPIILLVGDHGTNSLRYSSAKSAETVTPAQARERFGAFGAFHLPAGGGRLFADSVTLVNVIPKVLNYYFGAGIPLAPDSLYMSLEQTPYLFAPVDAASLAGGG
jgi:hypothetical protein